jgi:hypothetical protein
MNYKNNERRKIRKKSREPKTWKEERKQQALKERTRDQRSKGKRRNLAFDLKERTDFETISQS